MRLKIDHRSVFVLPMTVEDAEEQAGLFCEGSGTIEIDARASSEEQGALLFHEIIHAVWASRDMPARATEEQVCQRIGRGLATVFRDNPGLGGALEDALNHGVPIVGVSK